MRLTTSSKRVWDSRLLDNGAGGADSISRRTACEARMLPTSRLPVVNLPDIPVLQHMSCIRSKVAIKPHSTRERLWVISRTSPRRPCIALLPTILSCSSPSLLRGRVGARIRDRVRVSVTDRVRGRIRDRGMDRVRVRGLELGLG